MVRGRGKVRKRERERERVGKGLIVNDAETKAVQELRSERELRDN